MKKTKFTFLITCMIVLLSSSVFAQNELKTIFNKNPSNGEYARSNDRNRNEGLFRSKHKPNRGNEYHRYNRNDRKHYYRHDNGKHKGWYKHKKIHKRPHGRAPWRR